MAKKLKDTDYLFISTYLHSRERDLLTGARMERMIEAPTAADAAKVLGEIGYGEFDASSQRELGSILAQEQEKLFEDLYRFVPDKAVVDVFKVKYDYHNLKALIKARATGTDASDRLLLDAGRVSAEDMRRAVWEGDYSLLPPALRQSAVEAAETLSATGDPQLADFLLDRAYYAEMLSAARATGSDFLVRYVRFTIDAANLRSAVRTLRMKKGADMLRRVLVEGGSIRVDSVQGAALGGNLEELYRSTELRQAAELGAAVVVFGSAGAKRVPVGFSMERAWEQVADITRYAGEEAAKRGITIAIEPVRHPDCNIINTFAEGVSMARETGLDSVKVLVDLYHLACEGENPDILRQYGAEYLRHVHFSYPNFPEIDGVSGPEQLRGMFEGELDRRGWWRTWPSSREEWGYAPFIQALKGCGYDGRVSIEAPVGNFEVQAPRTLAFLKEAF